MRVSPSLFLHTALALLATTAPLAESSVKMPVSFDEVLALAQPPPDAELRYGTGVSQFGRLWFSATGSADPAPVIVLVHGGCWLHEYSIDHIHALAGALAEAGYVVWALEYRRLGEDGSGWPGTFEDVAAGVDFLRHLPPARLDLSRVVAVGHSAGGHLALWAAARGAFSPEHPLYSEQAFTLRGAIGLAAITDLAAYARGSSDCEKAVPRLLGGLPEQEAQRYQWASPVALEQPLPVVLLQGSDDAIVPESQTRAMPDARVRMVDGAGHFDLIHPGTPVFDELLQELNRMLGP